MFQSGMRFNEIYKRNYLQNALRWAMGTICSELPQACICHLIREFNESYYVAFASLKCMPSTSFHLLRNGV